jgi:hypothetical protein
MRNFIVGAPRSIVCTVEGSASMGFVASMVHGLFGRHVQ